MFPAPPKTRYDVTFSIAKIPVRIHPFFWLIAMALGWGDISLLEIIVWAGCVFVSVLVHELGHALVARHFGATNIRILLHGMGGETISNSHLNRKERILEILGGPGAGFLLLAIVFITSKILFPIVHYPLFHFAAQQLLYINLVWSCLNLLPILPLDGGQILREVICIKRPWDGADLTVKISIILSTVVAILFGISAVIAMVRGTTSHWYPAIIFALLAAMNYHMYKHKYRFDENPSEQESRNPWERDPDWWKN